MSEISPMSDSRVTVRAASIAALFLASQSPVLAQGGLNGLTARVSLNSMGAQVFASSALPSISRDGARVAFETTAALVPADTNGLLDVYVVEPATGVVMLASTTVGGGLGNGASYGARISGDGQFVAYTTMATNAIGFDTNGDSDVMLRNLQTGALKRVSANIGSIMAPSEPSHSPSVSFDGRYVAFVTFNDFAGADANNDWDVYVRDMQLDTLTLVSRSTLGGGGNSSSLDPAISDDGRFIAFSSYASNLVAGDTNMSRDVFVRTPGGSIELVSRVPGGVLGNDDSTGASISSDGRYVAFATAATNFLVGDTNTAQDVYVLDRTLQNLRLVTRSTSNGFCASTGGAHPSISGDGSVVAFYSSAPDIASDAAAFTSIYARNMKTSVTRLVSRSTGFSSSPNGVSYSPAVNQDGSMIAFYSSATNLTPGDFNAAPDVFVRKLIPDPVAYCSASVTSGGCEPGLSSTGAPRAGQNSGFVVHCNEAPNNKAGLLFYGVNGRMHAPFLSGTMCVQLPVARTAIAQSGGNPASIDDCSGSFHLDMNSFAVGALGGSPMPELSVVGQRVNVQYWGRDPAGLVATTFLSNALEYVVGP